jgi:hypothetical protein
MMYRDPYILVTQLMGALPSWAGWSYGQRVSFCRRVHELPDNNSKREFWIRLWRAYTEDPDFRKEIRRYYDETIHHPGQMRLEDRIPELVLTDGMEDDTNTINNFGRDD